MIKSDYIKEEKHNIDGIPVIRLVPKYTKEPLPTIIFYHGWSSSKEVQLMSGIILASFGYQIILPDAISHGERGSLDYNDPLVIMRYFWPTILNNMEEYPKIRDYAEKNFNADINRLGISGNSMGGFTASGIYTYNSEIKSLVVLNGSCNWANSNSLFKELLKVDSPNLFIEEEKISKIDPMNNLEKIIDRPILMLHGEADSIVDIISQKKFYRKANSLYTNGNKIHLISYKNINHTISNKMMEEMVKWFNKFI